MESGTMITIRKIIALIAWLCTIAVVATAGAWKLGEGGGFLVLLAFVMVLMTSFSTKDDK